MRNVFSPLFTLPILLIAVLLSACGATAGKNQSSNEQNLPKDLAQVGKTRVVVIGTLHSAHLRRKKYSLEVLEKALRAFEPDQVLAEIPPDRIAQAWRGFNETGKVNEARVAVFPEFRDLLFPLTKQLDFEIVPVAAWTKKLADERRQKLRRIENDPSRANEWADYLAGRQSFNRAARGKWDDPIFIHSVAYDAAVAKMQSPYESHFEKDLGAGGWGQVNTAHYALIDGALNRIEGQGKRVMILFGAWHKYKFMDELRKRDDIILEDASVLFAQ